MPAITRQRVPVFPTPDLRDLLFWERDTMSRTDYTDLVNNADKAYGTAHYDTDKFPNHKLVFWQADPDFQTGNDGQDSLRVRKYYAADRADQDDYNYQHTTANISGQQFDVVKRTYLIPRESWEPAVPALGAAMSTDPNALFAPDYVLAEKKQTRTGQKELDSLYVVEERTYIKRVDIITSRYDESTNGVLQTTRRIWFRGEVYDSTPDPDVNIEDAVVLTNDTIDYWRVTEDGQISEFTQLNEDTWAVVTQDVIPQVGRPTTPAAIFGGKVLREYNRSVNYTWPAVLADGTTGDGSGTGGFPVTGLITDAFEITDWEYKDGGFRYYVRPVYKRTAYSGPCPALIHEEWVTPDQLATAESSGNKITQGTDIMEPKRVTYMSPHLSVNTAPVLHNGVTLKADTGSNDPTWGENVGSSRYFTATTDTDWPTSLVAEIEVRPFRGGYVIRRVVVYPPHQQT